MTAVDKSIETSYGGHSLWEPLRRVILVCDEGYASSLAAATLQRVGVERATDLIGGFQALRQRRS